MKYNKLTQYSTNDENPFLDDTIQHIEKGDRVMIYSGKSPDVIVNSDGEVTGSVVMARRIKVDKAQFTKVYRTGLANWYDLSKSAIRVFAYVVEVLKPNRDSIDFDLDKCKKFTGYTSKNTITNALSELIGNKFLARGSNPYKYYINPTIFFNGSRITFIEQIDLVDSKTLEGSKKASPKLPSQKTLEMINDGKEI